MMNMRFLRVPCLVLFLMGLSLTGTASDGPIQSQWTAVPMKIDGNHADWTNQEFTYEKKGDVDFAFRNDAQYMYVLFIFKSKEKMSNVTQSGVTIYFNTEGKKKKDYGINFASIPVSADQFISMIEQRQGPLPEERKAQLKANPRYYIQNYHVINKKNKDAELPTGEYKRAVFRSSRRQDLRVYEFAIPFEKASPKAPGIGTEAGKDLKICFEWGGMTEAMKQARLTQIGAATTRTSATKAGGLGSERSDGRASSSSLAQIRRKSPKRYDFWVDVKLDVQK